LRVVVRGVTSIADRWEAYQRVRAYQSNPRGVIEHYREETEIMHGEILAAREKLPAVKLAAETAELALQMAERLNIVSHRASAALFEAARALAAADNRDAVTAADIRTLAPLALRMRRSAFLTDYFTRQGEEEQELRSLMDEVLPAPPPPALA
jgi:Mg-chelatase subunit ChlI